MCIIQKSLNVLKFKQKTQKLLSSILFPHQPNLWTSDFVNHVSRLFVRYFYLIIRNILICCSRILYRLLSFFFKIINSLYQFRTYKTLYCGMWDMGSLYKRGCLYLRVVRVYLSIRLVRTTSSEIWKHPKTHFEKSNTQRLNKNIMKMVEWKQTSRGDFF